MSLEVQTPEGEVVVIPIETIEVVAGWLGAFQEATALTVNEFYRRALSDSNTLVSELATFVIERGWNTVKGLELDYAATGMLIALVFDGFMQAGQNL